MSSTNAHSDQFILLFFVSSSLSLSFSLYTVITITIRGKTFQTNKFSIRNILVWLWNSNGAEKSNFNFWLINFISIIKLIIIGRQKEGVRITTNKFVVIGN